MCLFVIKSFKNNFRMSIKCYCFRWNTGRWGNKNVRSNNEMNQLKMLTHKHKKKQHLRTIQIVSHLQRNVATRLFLCKKHFKLKKRNNIFLTTLCGQSVSAICAGSGNLFSWQPLNKKWVSIVCICIQYAGC